LRAFVERVIQENSILANNIDWNFIRPGPVKKVSLQRIGMIHQRTCLLAFRTAVFACLLSACVGNLESQERIDPSNNETHPPKSSHSGVKTSEGGKGNGQGQASDFAILVQN